jgi:arylsulfatase A-like enzyme
VCDLVGTGYPEGLDGKSLQPVIAGGRRGVRDTVFYAYRDVQRAIRDERWKLIRYPEIHKTQLFDLNSDPGERKDLAADPVQADRINSMMRRLAQRQKELGDTLPLTAAERRDEAFTPPAGDALKSPQPRRGRSRPASASSPHSAP